MPELIISKQYTFDAAHQLIDHKGKCARLHGHTYILTVAVKGTPAFQREATSQGMVMDYDDLDAIVKPIIEHLDHRNLNDLFVDVRTTAENIAIQVGNQINQELQDHYVQWSDAIPKPRLASVTVQETPKTTATVLYP